MKKKIRITESQLDLIIKLNKSMSLLNESELNKFILEPEPGDVLSFETTSGAFNSIVKSSIGGQIIIQDTNEGSNTKGSYFFFVASSFVVNTNEGTLVCKTINPNKLKDGEIVNSPGTWKLKYTIKGIQKISIIRNGNVIDSLDGIGDSKDSKKKKDSEISETYRDLLNDTLLMLTKVSAGTNILFKFKNGAIYTFEKTEDGNPINLKFIGGSSKIPVDTKMYLNIMIPSDDSDVDLLEFNKKTISINEDDTYNLVVKSDIGGKDMTIENITSIDFTKADSGDKEDDVAEPEEKEPEKVNKYAGEYKGPQDVYMDKEEIINRIVSDPTLKNAFYKSPKLLGFITSGEPSGISAANKIINAWQDSGKSLDTKIYEKFRNGSLCKFTVDEPINVNFEDGDVITMNKGKVYYGRVFRGGGRVKIYYPKERGKHKVIMVVIGGKPNNRLVVRYGPMNSDGDLIGGEKDTIHMLEYNTDAIKQS